MDPNQKDFEKVIEEARRAIRQEERGDRWRKDFTRPYYEWWVMAYRILGQRSELVRLHARVSYLEGQLETCAKRGFVPTTKSTWFKEEIARVFVWPWRDENVEVRPLRMAIVSGIALGLSMVGLWNLLF